MANRVMIENRMGTAPPTGCATPADTSIIRLQVQGAHQLQPLHNDSGDGHIPNSPLGSFIPAGSDSMTFNTTASVYRIVIEMGSWTAGGSGGFVQRRYTNYHAPLNVPPVMCVDFPFYRYLDFTVTDQGPGVLTLQVQPSGNQYKVDVQGGTARLSEAVVGQKTITDFTRTAGPYTPVNEKPVLNAQRFSVAENSANATVVGTVVATDPDGAQPLTYRVTGGTGQGVFAVNLTTGQITVANSSRLDFEATPSFTLQVQVTDNGTPQLSTSATITIELTNVNEEDQPPPAAPVGVTVR